MFSISREMRSCSSTADSSPARYSPALRGRSSVTCASPSRLLIGVRKSCARSDENSDSRLKAPSSRSSMRLKARPDSTSSFGTSSSRRRSPHARALMRLAAPPRRRATTTMRPAIDTPSSAAVSALSSTATISTFQPCATTSRVCVSSKASATSSGPEVLDANCAGTGTLASITRKSRPSGAVHTLVKAPSRCCSARTFSCVMPVGSAPVASERAGSAATGSSKRSDAAITRRCPSSTATCRLPSCTSMRLTSAGATRCTSKRALARSSRRNARLASITSSPPSRSSCVVSRSTSALLLATSSTDTSVIDSVICALIEDLSATNSRRQADTADPAPPVRRCRPLEGAAKGRRGWFIHSRLEHVADAAQRVDQLVVERIVQLGAQTAHGDIDDVGVAVEIHVPHLIGDQRARQHLACVAHEIVEQCVFARGQLDAAACASDAPAQPVDLEVGDAHHLVVLGRPAAQDGADARQQLGEREGLHQVVVGAELQALDAVLYLVARADEEHRRLALATDALQHAEAIHARHHHVHQHQVVAARGGQVQAFGAVAGDVDDVGVLCQALADIGRGLRFVVDDQDAHGFARL